MLHKFFTKFPSLLRFFVTSFLVVVFVISASTSSSYASDDRVRACTYETNPSDKRAYMCKYDPTLKADPIGVTGNKDIDWDLSNTTCIAYMASVGTAAIVTGVASGIACATPKGTPPIPLSFTKVISIASNFAQCAIMNAAAAGSGTACCIAAGVETAAYAAAIAAVFIIYAQAKKSFEYSRVCGHNWQTWQQLDTSGNPSSSGAWKKGKNTGSYQKSLYDEFVTNGTTANRTITNKRYREFLYGGIEYEDNGSDACSNPSTWDSTKQNTRLGYYGGNQRYYMTGAGLAGVYACYRFLSSADDAGAKAAYNCCKTRSQNAMCIESVSGLDGSLGDYQHQFCTMGSKCSVGGVSYEIYASKLQSNYVCAKSYSVCPYNHNLGGGTETKSMYTSVSHAGQVINFCQYMNHCSKLPIPPYVHTSGLGAAFISQACRDLKGDTQNTFANAAEQLPVSTRNFSAPIVQCFKETMENLLLNKAGYTECLDPDNYPDENGICPGNDYKYQRGQDLPTPSFFSKIQNRLQDIIKMTLVISVMFLGMTILLGMKPIEKKVLLVYILKIGLVMYFAVGDGWHQLFMDKMLATSTFLAEMTFKPDVSADPAKQDGCQFPRFNYANKNTVTKYDNPAYAEGKGYLSVWDTLDCKLAMAVGFGPEVSVPNIALMIVGGFFTGGLGIIFVVGAFCFAFFLLSLTVRAAHIFILSMTSVIILIFISPIPITLAMFAKTKNIFDQWWKQILGLALQPMILFVYLGIMITIFDNVVVGDATFIGNGHEAPKTIDCQNPSASEIWKGAANASGVHDSIYCIFRVSDIQTYSGLEPIGIGIPMLATMTKDKVSTIIQAALLMFIFSTFMDKISGFARILVGGEALSSSGTGSVSNMAKTVGGAMRGIQKRGMGLGKKVAGAFARKGGAMAKGAINAVGNKGKNVADRDSASANNAPKVASSAEQKPQVASGKANSPQVGNNP